jgi:ribosomal protein L40E
MNLTENLGNSFNYAKKLLSDGGRLIILIVLDLIPVVNWIVLGYAAHVLREAPASEAPPKLENYGKLFTDGAKVSIASMIYMIVPLALIVSGAVSMGAGIFGGEAASLVLGGFGVVLLLVGLLLAFIFLIFLGVGIAHMVKTGKFGKAFAFGEILTIIKGIGWGKYLGWAVVTVIIAMVVGGLTSSIPYVGWLLSAIISPFLSVFIFRSLGDLYNDGAPTELRVSSVSAAGMGGITCASCGAQLQPHHKFCPVCGTAAPVPATIVPSTVEASKFCIACGARVPVAAGFCGSCGAKQN